MDKFTSHSTRAASTSRIKAAGLNLQQIMESAGWFNFAYNVIEHSWQTVDNSLFVISLYWNYVLLLFLFMCQISF